MIYNKFTHRFFCRFCKTTFFFKQNGFKPEAFGRCPQCGSEEIEIRRVNELDRALTIAT